MLAGLSKLRCSSVWRSSRALQVPAKYYKLRQYSTQLTSKLQFSPEVRSALLNDEPVVALESTIITHGLPFPTNVEMALAVEDTIRSEGVVPATVAFLKGVPHVGLNQEQLNQLAGSVGSAHKVSRRDIPYVIAHQLDGGTTISGTMIAADKAGIRVFATGGLGGVHRGVAEHLDISADLEELGKTPVAVVCSGPKSILDIPKTIEYLETKGCHVSTYSPSGSPTNIPGFFVTDSGVKSPFTFGGPLDAAKVVESGLDFGLNSGYVFCVPVPESMALDPKVAHDAIEFALLEADKQGITGKESTPFLLKKVWEATGGISVKTNVEFVKNNAKMAAKIAKELVGKTATPTPNLSVHAAAAASPATSEPASEPIISTESVSNSTSSDSLGKPLSHLVDVAVVGALSQDITCTLNTKNVSVSSYPGRITTSLGGTAHNVALASAYTGAKTRLVSCVGDREQSHLSKSVSPVLDVSGVKVSHRDSTPRYVCTNDSNGELIIACADMDAIANLDGEYVREQLDKAQPKLCVFDGNLGPQAVTEILKIKQRQENTVNRDPLVLFEPTSVPKAAKLAHQPDLGVFPNNNLDIATPNYLELMSMYEEFSFADKFDIHNWFPIIDQLPLGDAVSRMKLDVFSRSHPALADVVQSGLVQASVQLLPYIPNLFVTSGANGIISFQLIENLKDRTGGVLGGPHSVYIMSKNKPFGILIQHFPVTHPVAEEDARSVNGIGDTFCGALASQLAEKRFLLRDDGPEKKEMIDRAMHAASLSLQTYQAVSSEITTLFEE